MTVAANAALIRRYLAETGAGRLEVLDELVDGGAIFHSWACPDAYLPPAIGPAGQKEHLALFRAAFPDAAVTVGRLGVTAAMAVVRWTARGTHRGALLGRPATGRAVTWKGTTIYCLAGGKIEDEWGNLDLAGLLRQLDTTTDGVLPVGESAGATPRLTAFSRSGRAPARHQAIATPSAKEGDQ
ncbi:MAG TPA: ester cyclase [Thermomicrobiales bacterium]|nr:ester cyclase [Thermomicrobiales bacterium]